MTYTILNASRGSVIATRASKADSFLSRMTGLLNRDTLLPGEALILTQCQSIHMFFMRFPIDVIFVGSDNYVVGLVENIMPFSLSPVFLKASYAIEAEIGTIARSDSSVGDKIEIASATPAG